MVSISRGERCPFGFEEPYVAAQGLGITQSQEACVL